MGDGIGGKMPRRWFCGDVRDVRDMSALIGRPLGRNSKV